MTEHIFKKIWPCSIDNQTDNKSENQKEGSQNYQRLHIHGHEENTVSIIRRHCPEYTTEDNQQEKIKKQYPDNFHVNIGKQQMPVKFPKVQILLNGV